MNAEAETLMSEVRHGEEALQSLKDEYTDYPPVKEFLWDRIDVPWLKQQGEIKAAYKQGVEAAAKVAEELINKEEFDYYMPRPSQVAAAIRALIKPETAK